MKKTTLSLLAVCFVLLVGLDAVAQVYPPPTNTPRRTPRPSVSPRPGGDPEGTDEPPFSPRPTPPRTPSATARGDCMNSRGEVGNDFEEGRVEYRGDLLVEGDEGCAPPNSDVDISIHSHEVFLGTVEAAEDGSFRGTFTLPAHIRPGDHTVIADIEGRGRLTDPIIVIGEEDEVGGAADDADDAGGSGVLPRTGAMLLKLLLWAVVLVGLGSLLLASTWKWSQNLAPVRAVGSRFHRGRTRGSGEIQRVDTSGFVPERTMHLRRDASGDVSDPNATLTEWDIASRDDRPS